MTHNRGAAVNSSYEDNQFYFSSKLSPNRIIVSYAQSAAQRPMLLFTLNGAYISMMARGGGDGMGGGFGIDKPFQLAVFKYFMLVSQSCNRIV